MSNTYRNTYNTYRDLLRERDEYRKELEVCVRTMKHIFRLDTMSAIKECQKYMRLSKDLYGRRV